MLVFALLDFLRTIVEYRAFRQALMGQMSHILYYSIFYMQITCEEENRWTDDVNEFVADEEAEGYLSLSSSSVRGVCVRLLNELMERAFRDNSSEVMMNAFVVSLNRLV